MALRSRAVAGSSPSHAGQISGLSTAGMLVELGAQFVRLGGDDGECADPLAGRRMPVLPQARERHDAAIGERDRVGLFAPLRFLPFVKVVDRHETAPTFEGLAKSRLVLDPFRLGVDVGETDLMSLAQ